MLFQQPVVFGSLLSDLVRAVDLFFEQGVKCVHKICWWTLLNNFADFLGMVDGVVTNG